MADITPNNNPSREASIDLGNAKLPSLENVESLVQQSFLSRASSKLAVAGLSLLSLLGSCTTTKMALHPREPKPLATEVKNRLYLPPYSEVAAENPEAEKKRTRVEDGVKITETKLRVGGAELKVRIFSPAQSDGPKPFIVMLPIMAGGKFLNEIIGMRLARQGYIAGDIERLGEVFKDNETVQQLDSNLCATVRHQRALIDWMSKSPEVDANKIGCIGVSMGGIVGTVLVAAEPKIDAAVLCLAGGDFSDIIMHTTLPRVYRWGTSRCESDKELQHGDKTPSLRMLAKYISTHMDCDPALVGMSIDTNKVLLITANYDITVPARTGDILWESLGRPERIKIPLEHFTTVLCIDFIMKRTDQFFRRKLELPPAEVEGARFE